MKFSTKFCFTFLVLLNCFSIQLHPQAPDTLWVKYYSPGIDYDKFFSVVQTSDSGFVATGYPIENTIVVKTDSDGDTIWTYSYSGSEYYSGMEIKQSSDNGYIIIGGDIDDLWLCKLDSSGNYLWDKIYGGGWHDYGHSVDQTNDGGFIVTGSTSSFSPQHNDDIWLLKTNSLGDTLWTKVIGGTDDDNGYSVQETDDGGIVLGGETNSFGAGASDIWLLKMDEDGDTIWTRTYGGANYDECGEVNQTKDGGYIIIGYTKSFGAGSYDCWLIKTDSLGNTQWTKTFGGTGQEYAYCVDELENGGYIFSGKTYSYGMGAFDMYLVRTDTLGNLVWSRTGISVNGDGANSVEQTFDGGFIVGGFVYKYAALMRLAPENLLPSVNVLNPNGGEELIINSEYSITWNSNGIDSVMIDYSTNNGAGWMTVTSSIPASLGTYLWTIPNTPSIQCLIKISDIINLNVNDQSDSLFAIKDISGIEEDEIPESYKLFNNYPNPFNPTTKIKYQIPELSLITIRVYDVLGKEIATLVNEEKPVGNYEVDFDGTNLTSGIYFYRLQAGDYIETKKMILLR